MNNLAIIPARGGSKRIRHKNARDFLGKPIITYSIEAALLSGLFEEVMVSTDDGEIAEIAVAAGAKVPFLRSAGTSGDNATTMEVIQEVVAEYKNRLGREFDLVCCIYATAPLIRTEALKDGLNLLIEKNYHSVFPVVAFGYPVWRGLEVTGDGKARMIWPEYENSRSQDLKSVYHDAGQWYWLNLNECGNSVFTGNSGSIVLSEEEVQDIDTLADWQLAEMKYEIMKTGKL